MMSFRGRYFYIFLDCLDTYSTKEWEVWIARQQKTEPELLLTCHLVIVTNMKQIGVGGIHQNSSPI